MYIVQTKKQNGLLIVDHEKRYFVANQDMKELLEGKYINRGGKPLIVLQPFPEKEEQSTFEKK